MKCCEYAPDVFEINLELRSVRLIKSDSLPSGKEIF
jgi:hypothetical protein